LSSFAKNAPDPSFVIRPDKGAKMSDILAAINALRVSPKADMRIEVDADLNVFIPKKLDPNAGPPKPNPLFLLVEIDGRSNILLNTQKKGTFPATSNMEQRLKDIFRERENNGVWLQGTNTTDTTVFIRLAGNMTFENLAELARTIKRAGSDNIGLQVDEGIKMVEVELKQP
ncbi:MAG: hypothetical protein ABL952_16475, partial [Pyrinomonadaceae bacterium]